MATASLQDRRRIAELPGRGGAERLLTTLVTLGLDERAYRAAALLVLELDRAPDRTPAPRRCGFCRTSLDGYHPNAVYCSALHRQRAFLARRASAVNGSQ